MSAYSEWKQKLEDARDRKDRIEVVLLKRKARVRFTRRRYRGWKAKQDATGSVRATRKEAFWHEQFHKAVLGKKDYEAREARIEKKIAYLVAHKPEVPHAVLSGVSVPVRPWNPYRRPIANWIIPWLDKSYSAGWRGVVTSGWRDPQYSTSLCYHMCGAPTCPGRCAGATSNHSGSVYPGGAVDLTDYYTFAAIQHRIGSPLRNALGAADPVHFSYSGR